jgi:hypothetical protein
MAETTSSHSHDLTQLSELGRLAEDDGATFLRSATGSWWERDKDDARSTGSRRWCRRRQTRRRHNRRDIARPILEVADIFRGHMA